MSKEKNKLHKWIWATSSMVIIYALVFFLIMSFQFIISVVVKYNIPFHGKAIANFINGNINLPMNTLAIIWVALCAAYCGVDRASYLVKSSTECIGSCDVGDPAMLRFIILIAGFLFLAGIIFSGFSEMDYQLNLLASAWGSSIVLYVAGQKGIKMAKYINTSKNKDKCNPKDYCETEKNYCGQ